MQPPDGPRLDVAPLTALKKSLTFIKGLADVLVGGLPPPKQVVVGDSLETKVGQSAPALTFQLLLFVGGNEPNSRSARHVLSGLREQYLQDRFEIQIIDVLEDYQMALLHQIKVVPTLIVETPTRKTIFVGSLHDREELLLAFSIFNGEVRP